MLLYTARLVIRKFKASDLISLIDMFSDEEVMKFIGPRRAMTEAETKEWLINILQRQDTELSRYAVALKENDELIGAAGLKDEDGARDFGYYFRRKYWGCGYAREACSALIRYIEDELHLNDYQIFIADENVHSLKMIEKLGMQAVEAINKSGEQGHLYKHIP
jgi:ribosomal-protein-alanine N-acetyltransferase